MTSPKGPKVVVRTVSGNGLFLGQLERLTERADFRKKPRKCLGQRQARSTGRRSWRSARQRTEEADRVSFTTAETTLFVLE